MSPDELVERLIGLHVEVRDSRGFRYCRVCAQDDYGELDYATWPCQTARLLAEYLGGKDIS